MPMTLGGSHSTGRWSSSSPHQRRVSPCHDDTERPADQRTKAKNVRVSARERREDDIVGAWKSSVCISVKKQWGNIPCKYSVFILCKELPESDGRCFVFLQRKKKTHQNNWTSYFTIISILQTLLEANETFKPVSGVKLVWSLIPLLFANLFPTNY